MNPKRLFLGIVIFITALVIIIPRFYHLSTQPPGLHIDEVSFAAEAIAIAETGRDTWNQPWPLVFKAFGEWKAPGLVYTVAFWNKVLGRMDNFVTRLPSALAGITILITFGYTLRLLFPESSRYLTLFSIFILAFSPWHFDMSRIFYEAFSALAFFAISVYLITKATLTNPKNLKLWYMAAIFAGISGYFYASVRYIVIVVLLIALALQNWSLKLKIQRSLLILLTLLVVGFGWVGELASDKGLNRLYYYDQKSKAGATLAIDEKRQYCFLTLGRNLGKTKLCYLLWNKPVLKLTDAGKSIYTYLGSDYLFVKSISEFGFDSEYGAYLLPLLPIYLIGLFFVLQGSFEYLSLIFKPKSKSSSRNRIYLLYILTAIVSLIPSAIANNVNMRMGLISLYIVAVIIGIGFFQASNYLSTHLRRYSIIFNSVFVLVISFFIVQSVAHYFLVFTRSNDWQWTSDSSDVFGYVKSVSSQYDRIVDTTLHGPYAPYFYGDLTTGEVQTGDHSYPDAFDFVYLIKAGKYELIHKEVGDLACEKWGNSDKRKTLVISENTDHFAPAIKHTSYTLDGAKIMHQVYDLDLVIQNELQTNSSFRSTCTAK